MTPKIRAQFVRFVRKTLKTALGPRGPARNTAVQTLAAMVLAQRYRA